MLARRRIEVAYPRGVGDQPTRVDVRVLELADELRPVSITTAIFTNGTDSIAEEMTAMGLTGRFDADQGSRVGFATGEVINRRPLEDRIGVANTTFPDQRATRRHTAVREQNRCRTCCNRKSKRRCHFWWRIQEIEPDKASR